MPLLIPWETVRLVLFSLESPCFPQLYLGDTEILGKTKLTVSLGRSS